MSYETSNYDNEQPIYDTNMGNDAGFEQEGEGFAARDAYPTSDILPTDELSALASAIDSDAHFILPERPPFTIEHIYENGGTPVADDHLDGTLQRYMQKRVLLRAQQEEIIDSILTNPACRDNRDREIYAAVNTQLAADFGPEVGSAPITLLTEAGVKQMHEKLPIQQKYEGANILGRMVIFSREDDPYYAMLTGLHEGAHFAASDKKELIMPFHISKAEHATGMMEKRAGWQWLWTHSNGFTGFPPNAGVLWEEGFATSYALRRLEALGLTPHQYGNLQAERVSARLADLRFVDDMSDAYYDAGERIVHVPWKYARLFPNQANGWTAIGVSEDKLTAYAIDLLDERLPGLFDEMMQSRGDPDMKNFVRERINSIGSRQAYDNLAGGRYNLDDAVLGLIHIMRCLGLAGDSTR
jgi:hypothetical protein